MQPTESCVSNSDHDRNVHERLWISISFVNWGKGLYVGDYGLVAK